MPISEQPIQDRCRYKWKEPTALLEREQRAFVELLCRNPRGRASRICDLTSTRAIGQSYALLGLAPISPGRVSLANRRDTWRDRYRAPCFGQYETGVTPSVLASSRRYNPRSSAHDAWYDTLHSPAEHWIHPPCTKPQIEQRKRKRLADIRSV
jgi:hypothetical protein